MRVLLRALLLDEVADGLDIEDVFERVLIRAAAGRARAPSASRNGGLEKSL